MYEKIKNYTTQNQTNLIIIGFLLFLISNSHYFKSGFYPGDDGDSRAIVYIFESLTSKIKYFNILNFFDIL